VCGFQLPTGVRFWLPAEQRTRRARARRPRLASREAAVPAALTTDSIAPAISIEIITPFEIEDL
jgi:hypothetical protein